jgi:hypothetical protein
VSDEGGEICSNRILTVRPAVSQGICVSFAA